MMHQMVAVLCSRDDSQNLVLGSNLNCCYQLDIGMQPHCCCLHRLVEQHPEDSMAYDCNDCRGSPSTAEDIYVVSIKSKRWIRHVQIQIIESHSATFFYRCPFGLYLCPDLDLDLCLSHGDLYCCGSRVGRRRDSHRTNGLFCDHHI